MNYLKKHRIILLMMLISSCGGAGHIQFYNFIVSKSDAKSELNKVINLNGYSAPLHWNQYEQGKNKEDIFIYFKSGPRELYVVAFADYSDNPAYKDRTVRALIGAFDGKLWHFASDLSWSEQSRIEERFEKEILNKVKVSYTKE